MAESGSTDHRDWHEVCRGAVAVRALRLGRAAPEISGRPLASAFMVRSTRLAVSYAEDRQVRGNCSSIEKGDLESSQTIR